MNNERTFLEKIKIFIKFCDIIGKKPELKIGNKDRYQTILGGLLCILIYLLVVIGIGYFGQDLVFKQNPIVTESTFYRLVTCSYKEILRDFRIKLEFDNEASNISFDNIIDLEVGILNNTSYIKDHILAYKCPNSNNQEICFSYNNTNDLNRYKIIITMNNCNNSITNNCIKNINTKILEKTKVTLIYSNNIFNPKNYSSPNYSYEQQYISYLNSNKSISITFENVMFMTDKGFIIEDYRTTNFSSVKSIFETPKVKTSNDLISIEIDISDLDRVYYRQYVKIQKLIAEIGGLIKSFIVVSYIMTNWYSEGQLFIKMIDSLFDSDEVNKYFHSLATKDKNIYKKFRDSIALKHIKDFNYKLEKVNASDNNLKVERSIQAVDNEQDSHIINGNNFSNIFERRQEIYLNNFVEYMSNINNVNSELEKLKNNRKYYENYYLLKEKKFSMGFKEYFKIIWCKCMNLEYDLIKQKIAFEAGVELIRSRLDVINIFRKMQEYDRFKNIILKDYQKILLTSLSKFMLDPETINIRGVEVNYEKFINAYLTSKKSNTYIDKNLVEWVKMKYHFE